MHCRGEQRHHKKLNTRCMLVRSQPIKSFDVMLSHLCGFVCVVNTLMRRAANPATRVPTGRSQRYTRPINPDSKRAARLHACDNSAHEDDDDLYPDQTAKLTFQNCLKVVLLMFFRFEVVLVRFGRRACCENSCQYCIEPFGSTPWNDPKNKSTSSRAAPPSAMCL